MKDIVCQNVGYMIKLKKNEGKRNDGKPWWLTECRKGNKITILKKKNEKIIERKLLMPLSHTMFGEILRVYNISTTNNIEKERETKTKPIYNAHEHHCCAVVTHVLFYNMLYLFNIFFPLYNSSSTKHTHTHTHSTL